jgi:cytochrome c oxidase subunit 2
MVRVSILLSIAFFFFSCSSKTAPHKESGETIRQGKKLFTNLGCVTCHSVTGEKRYGPSLNNILNTRVDVIENGKTISITVDKDYLKKSIMTPDFQKVVGFERSKMSIPDISAEDTDCLVDYLVSVNSTAK